MCVCFGAVCFVFNEDFAGQSKEVSAFLEYGYGGVYGSRLKLVVS